MRRWWKSLGLVAGGLVSLGGIISSANAQFPPPGGVEYGMPPGGGMMAPPPGMGMGMPQGGGMMGPPPGMGMPPGGGMMAPPPGAFANAPAPGMPAEFPNPAQPSGEPTTPFSIKDEGMPNAFSELVDPRRRVNAPYALTIRGEYLKWRVTSGATGFPLVTTTPNPNFASFGQLSDASTIILVDSGSRTVDYGWTSGYRLTAGLAIGFLPPIEISGFQFNRTANVFSGGSLSNPTQFLAIPYQDVQPAFLIPGAGLVGTETAAVVAIPIGTNTGALGGTISIASQLSFWSFETNMFMPIGDMDVLHLSVLLGYRHLQLNETLGINTESGGQLGVTRFLGNTFPAGLFSTTTQDTFRTKNSFNGGQLGMRSVLDMGRWTFFSDVKLGLGATAQQLSVDGSTTLNQLVANRPSQTVPGGILAQPTNSGNFSINQFTFAPEANLALSFQLNSFLRVFGGYNALYWSSVARPGDAVSNTVDARQIPTSVFYTPGVSYNGPLPPSIVHRSFFAQGIFIGMEIGF